MSKMNPEQLKDARKLIDWLVRSGFMSAEQITQDVSSRVEAPDSEVAPLVAERMADQEKAEASWSEPTDCDRLDWVFKYLEATGIAARQNFTCCGTCAPGETDHLMRSGSADQPFVGCVYYGRTQAEGAPETGWLQVEYGTIKDLPEEMRRVGMRFMKAAGLAGLAPKWSGHPIERIRIKLNWQRRLFSTAKFQPEGAPDLSQVGTSLYKELGPWDDDDAGVVFSPMPDYVKEVLQRKEDAKALAAKLTGPIGMRCPTDGCNGELFRLVKPEKGTRFACLNQCSLPMFQDAPLTSGGPLGNGRCPQCGFLLVRTQSKYLPSVIKCLSEDCSFEQPATDLDVAVEAPRY